MRRSFTLGGRIYPTKEAAAKYCQGMLKGEIPIDQEFLLDLLKLHTEADLKIGCGVSRFEVRQNPVFRRSRSFYLIRTDGMETDWSYLHCLSPASHRTEVLEGMRTAIVDQVLRFKIGKFTSGENRCEVTNVILNMEQAHADHHPTSFMDLANRWREGLELSWEDIPVNETVDNSVVTRLVDANQLSSWQDYHQKHASLRLVTSKVNLSKGRN
jgi:hypothetical protein